jgi:hypothetical protein
MPSLSQTLPPVQPTFPIMTGVFKDQPVEREYFQSVLRIIEQGFSARTRDETARPYMFLQSPNGAVWQVTVSDVGALTAVKVLG